MNIDAAVAVIYHKINFLLDGVSALAVIYNTDVYGISTHDKLVVEHIFHNMSHIELPIIQACVSEPDVRVIVFVRIIEICLSLDIVSLRF